MIKATFTGRNASGYWSAWGVRFPCGEAVSVESAEAIAGVKRHPEFIWSDDPLDHDGDGVKGGSLPKRRRKRKAA